MKTKFKPTNLGRRPRGSNASTPKELAPCQQQDDMAGGDLPSEVAGANKVISDDQPAADSSKQSLSCKPATPPVAVPTPVDNGACPTTATIPVDFTSATTTPNGSEILVTRDAVTESSSVAPSASTTPLSAISDETTPNNLFSSPKTATSSSDLIASPDDSLPSNREASLLSQSTGSLSSGDNVRDSSPSTNEGAVEEVVLAMDANVPSEIFANSSSVGNDVVNHAETQKTDDAAGKGDSEGEASSKTPKDSKSSRKGTKRPRTTNAKSQSGEAAGLNGRAQPTKSSRKNRKRDISSGSKNDSSTSDKSPTGLSEDGRSPASSRSPPCKRPRTNRVREAPDKAVMTMRDLIYYNPSANPMTATFGETKKKGKSPSSATPSRSHTPSSPPQVGAGGANDLEREGEDQDDEDRIVPQLQIKNGRIIVDEESLTVKTTTNQASEIIDDVVMEGPGHTTSSSYRCKFRATKWTKDETKTFFTALGKVGTDFTMMTLLLPKRSRKELKNKFKKEEKSNPHLISQALSVQLQPRTAIST